MCGIAGILSSGPTTNSFLPTMLREMEHRGPDDDGWLLATPGEGMRCGRGPVPSGLASVALGHRRLAILDLAPTGAQPMVTPDGRFAMTYNGEIYNYVELREELERGGWRFRSTGDTEVLLAGWATWGAGVLRRLTGMFALCVVDFAAGRAFLARDPFGIKPLFIAQVGTSLLFASEIGALLVRGGVSAKLEPS